MSSLTLLKNQGCCNTTYILKTPEKSHIIKVFGILDQNRKGKIKIEEKIYRAGVGAKHIYTDNCFTIYEYIEGKHKNRLNFTDIKNVAKLLKKLHSIPTNSFKKDLVFCHHDLNPKNFIFSKSVKFIDWEYTYLDDRYFDLATVIVEFNLNKKEQKLFLRNYFQNNSYKNRKKLQFYKIKYAKLCKVWFKKNQKSKIKYCKLLRHLL